VESEVRRESVRNVQRAIRREVEIEREEQSQIADAERLINALSTSNSFQSQGIRDRTQNLIHRLSAERPIHEDRYTQLMEMIRRNLPTIDLSGPPPVSTTNLAEGLFANRWGSNGLEIWFAPNPTPYVDLTHGNYFADPTGEFPPNEDPEEERERRRQRRE
jgi:hypothetical protein